MTGVLEPVYLHRFTGSVLLADFGAGASGLSGNRGVNDRSSETKKLALSPGETEKNCRGNKFPSNVSCLTTSGNIVEEILRFLSMFLCWSSSGDLMFLSMFFPFVGSILSVVRHIFQLALCRYKLRVTPQTFSSKYITLYKTQQNFYLRLKSYIVYREWDH